MVVSTSYTSQQIINRGLEVYYESRDAGNLFDSILVLNPLSQIQDDLEGYDFEYPKTSKPTEKLIMVEGGIFFSKGTWRKFPRKFQFLVAQFLYFIETFKYLRSLNIMLVRGEDPRIAGFYAYILTLLFGKPLLIGVWGNPERIRRETERPMSPRLFRSCEQESNFERYILKKALLVLVQNYENKDYALKMGVSNGKIQFSKLGVGISKTHFTSPESRKKEINYDVKELLDKNGSSQILVCLSRLEEVKMVSDLVEVLAIIRESGLDAKLYFIGEGGLHNQIVQNAKKLNLENECIFLGNRDQTWISDFLVHCDLALVTLLGRALLEIGLAGCPVVAYDIDWHNELVINNNTGFLVPAKNVNLMASQSIKLLTDSHLRYQFSKNIREKSIEFANPELQAEEQVKLYNKIIEKI